MISNVTCTAKKKGRLTLVARQRSQIKMADNKQQTRNIGSHHAVPVISRERGRGRGVAGLRGYGILPLLCQGKEYRAGSVIAFCTDELLVLGKRHLISGCSALAFLCTHHHCACITDQMDK